MEKNLRKGMDERAPVCSLSQYPLEPGKTKQATVAVLKSC